MFFVISKVLNFVLNPIIWILILMLLALFIKNTRLKKRLLIIAIAVTWFFSNPFIIMEFYRAWEIQPVALEKLKPHYDCGVVLGGGMITYDSRYDRHTFRVNTDRIMQAIYLYKEGVIGKILISGGSGSLIYRNMREASTLKEFMVQTMEIPAEDILVDTISDNTHQNAVESAAIIKSTFNNPDILLITSAIHMRRSNLCFKKQGILADVYATDLTAGSRRYQFNHLFVPSHQSLQQWNKLLHEWVGIIMYKIMGYI